MKIHESNLATIVSLALIELKRQNSNQGFKSTLTVITEELLESLKKQERVEIV